MFNCCLLCVSLTNNNNRLLFGCNFSEIDGDDAITKQCFYESEELDTKDPIHIEECFHRALEAKCNNKLKNRSSFTCRTSSKWKQEKITERDLFVKAIDAKRNNKRRRRKD